MENNTTQTQKTELLDLFNQLDYNYQCVVINTFKCCAIYDTHLPKGSKPYDVAGVIKLHQSEKGYTDQEVCDKVNENIGEDDKLLDVDVYQKIKQRNTQSSKNDTNWLSKIAQVLDFSACEYRDFLSPEGFELTHKAVTDISSKIYSIDTLYDSLDEKDKRAIHQLVLALLNLQNFKE